MITMADRFRNRPLSADDDYAREPRQAQPQVENDPLAELARLIGQSDPFANFGREHQAAAPRRADPPAEPAGYDVDREPDAGELPPGPPAWMRRQPVAAPRESAPRYSYDEPYDPRAEAEGASYAAPGYDHQTPHYDDPYAPQQAQYDDVLYGQQPESQRQDYYGDQNSHYDQAYGTDDGYAAEPVGRPRRGGAMTVIAVLALAVIGTAGAYAYRSFVGSPRSGEPPIIKADAGPNKIVPPTQSGEGKLIYDRVGGQAGERVVSREEQPVDVKTQPSAATPRVVFPPLTQNPAPPTTSAVATAARPLGAGGGNGVVGSEEPRKIRTLSIRPDRPDVAMPTAATAATVAVPAPARAQAAPHGASPVASSGPMALTPQAQQQTPPNARVASVGPVGSTAANVGGPYVQLASQRTEADAMTSYKALQRKYPEILGSRAPAVKRADLGSKGVYYRAMVGPFGTTDEATQFCVNLQSAGGKCIVQRN